MTDDAKLIERLLDRLAALIEEREALLGENARLGGIIEFMATANAMQADSRAVPQELDPQQPGDPTNPFQRRNGPPGPDPFGGRFK